MVSLQKIFFLYYFAQLLSKASSSQTQTTTTTTTISYAISENNSNYYSTINPERGFYTQRTYRSSSPQRLSVNDLRAIREEEGLSLILRLYYLDSFITTTTLSDDVLSDITHDFIALGNTGLKCILRFAYSDDSNDAVLDATEEITLNHISQLKPILQEYGGLVIVSVQAGFIGAWGEWYYSTNYGNPSLSEPPNWESRAKVVEALLDALPSDKMIQIRTPLQKQSLMDTSTTIIASRLGHHNDCFLASDTDLGTYVDIPNEYPYLSQDTKTTIMGGETCGVYEPRSLCETALYELGYFHWTYINKDYKQEVLDQWELDGCMDEVKRRLGYSLLLKEGTYDVASSQGSTFWIHLNISNQGWAAPINSRRKLQFILRNIETGSTICSADDDHENVRNWYGIGGGATSEEGILDEEVEHSINVEARLPTDISIGTYELLLNIVDPTEGSLGQRPEYKIKVMNGAEYNEEGTGFIKLFHTLKIFEASSATQKKKHYSNEILFSCEEISSSSDILPQATLDGIPHISNGGFENSDVTWSSWGDETFSINENESHSGTRSARVTDGAAKQVISLTPAQSSGASLAGSSIKISGWSKLGVGSQFPTSNAAHYSLYADVTYSDGTYLFGQVATFEDSSSFTSDGWQYSEITFVLEKEADSISIYAMYRDPPVAGEAFFDDIEVHIDGINIVCPYDGYYINDNIISDGEHDEKICKWCPSGYECSSYLEEISCSSETYSTGGSSGCTPCNSNCNNMGECSPYGGLCVCDVSSDPVYLGAYCDILYEEEEEEETNNNDDSSDGDDNDDEPDDYGYQHDNDSSDGDDNDDEPDDYGYQYDNDDEPGDYGYQYDNDCSCSDLQEYSSKLVLKVESLMRIFKVT